MSAHRDRLLAAQHGPRQHRLPPEVLCNGEAGLVPLYFSLRPGSGVADVDNSDAEPKLPAISTASAVAVLVCILVVLDDWLTVRSDPLHSHLRCPFLCLLRHTPISATLTRCPLGHPWPDTIRHNILRYMLRDDVCYSCIL